MNEQRPSIAFILPSFAGGGAERVVCRFLQLLDKDKFAPLLIVMDPKGPLRSEIPVDVRQIVLGKTRLRHALPSLIRLLRREKPSLIFSTFSHVNLPLLAAKPCLGSAAIVVREANLPFVNIERLPFTWLIRRGYEWLYARADAIVVTSKRMAREMQELGICKSLLHHLANPIDEAALRAAAHPVVRHPGDGVRYVAAGRLTAQKGFDRLLEIIDKLPDNAHCTILGEGPERAALENRILELGLEGKVNLRGFVKSTMPFIAGADAFVMPSRFEGMPNAALEALAIGAHVIATPEAGGIGEVAAVRIEPMGDAFQKAMEEVKELGDGRLRESQLPDRFKAQNVADALNAFFAQLICHRKPAG